VGSERTNLKRSIKMPLQKGTERYRLWKEHIDEAADKRKNIPLSPEHCEKISESNKGRIKSKEECEHISKGLKNKPKTPEHRKHLSEANMGKTSPRKGVKLSDATKEKIRVSKLGMKSSLETCEKISESLIGNTRTLGYVHSDETKIKMRKSAHRGPDHPNYRGGITALDKAIRRLPEYDTWKYGVFERDDYTCRECGKRGGDMESHHDRKTFAQIIKDNNIRTIEDALNCKELWDIDNGVTLCVDCHDKRHTKKE
jgi:hypothetical protein